MKKKIKLVLTLELHPYWLAFTVLESFIYATKNEVFDQFSQL